jgi:hypothetical protein
VHGVVDAHRQIGKLIGVRDTNGVVEAMRLHLAGLSNRVHRDLVMSQLAKERSNFNLGADIGRQPKKK